MATLNISMEQLIEVIQGLGELEKIQIRSVLEEDFAVSEQAVEELRRRKEYFLNGKINAKPWDEVKLKCDSL